MSEVVSDQARTIRAGIEPEVPSMTAPRVERAAWDAAASDNPIAGGVGERSDSVGRVPGRWLSPLGGGGSIVVWCHGGGLTAGSSTTHRAFASRLALAAGGEVFLPDYRLLPEHGIDAPVHDVSSVLDGLDAAKTVVGGDSSGAALALSCLIAREAKRRARPAGFVALSGAFDATLSSPSVDEGRDPQLSRTCLRPWQDVVGAVCPLDDPRLSPVFADLPGPLPPALLLAGGDELWRDDSARLADRLTTAGTRVELEIIDGMWHVWPLWGDFPEARSALERIGRFARERTAEAT